ncbi:MAG: NAD(P)/FAD-dependent oxidoreductase [Bacteroidales bacterium]|nr:NAD(P)/FAD-dependent oxidoreductase [Bacteroidales bacterium]
MNKPLNVMPYEPQSMRENVCKVIIVGGGIAGLTAAAWLSKKGKKVLLIEKNEDCGGLVSSITRNGFHYEAGVRALLNAGIIFPMLHELDIELEVVKSSVSVGIEKEILHIEDKNSLYKYKDLLIRLYPESKADIEKLIKIIRRIMKDVDVLYGIDNPVIKDLWRDKRFIFRKLLPWLPKFLLTLRKIDKLQMPVEDYLKAIVKDPSLRDIITQHFFRKTPSFFALSYFSLYLEYFYPKGGVGKLAEAMEHRLRELGGEIKTGTVINRVLAGEHTIMDQNNVAYHYESLIWAADLKTLYKITDTRRLSERIRLKFEAKKKMMLAGRGGDSVYSLYLEVDEPLESFKQIAHGHFFYTPSKQGLGEVHTEELNKLLRNWQNDNKKQVFVWLGKLTRLNTYEISIPGLKNPDLSPKGKTGLIISFLSDYDLFEKVYESGWYTEFISELEKLVLSVLSDSVFPMLKDKVLNQFSFTPLSIKNRVSSSEGAITGWSFQEPIPVINQMARSARSVLTPIPSIFQAGQWVYSPSGVPMSILTGKLAADKVLKKS